MVKILPLLLVLGLFHTHLLSQSMIETKFDDASSTLCPNTSISPGEWGRMKDEFAVYTRDSVLYVALLDAGGVFCTIVNRYTGRSTQPTHLLSLSITDVATPYLEAGNAILDRQLDALDNNQLNEFNALSRDRMELQSAIETITDLLPQLNSKNIRIANEPSTDVQDTSILISSFAQSSELPSFVLSDSWQVNMYILRYARAISSDNPYSDYTLWRRTDGLTEFGPIHFGFNYSVLHQRSYDQETDEAKSTFSLGSIGGQISIPIVSQTNHAHLKLDLRRRELFRGQASVPTLVIRVYGGPWIGSFPSSESFRLIGDLEMTGQMDLSFSIGIFRPMISLGIGYSKLGTIPFVSICAGGGDERIMRNVRLTFPR